MYLSNLLVCLPPVSRHKVSSDIVGSLGGHLLFFSWKNKQPMNKYYIYMYFIKVLLSGREGGGGGVKSVLGIGVQNWFKGAKLVKGGQSL